MKLPVLVRYTETAEVIYYIWPSSAIYSFPAFKIIGYVHRTSRSRH
jgi:hypothetical protein